MKFFLLTLLATSAFAASTPAPKPVHKLDIWGTCYSGFHCQGGVVRNGVTGDECRQVGGHSLYAPNVERCFNL